MTTATTTTTTTTTTPPTTTTTTTTTYTTTTTTNNNNNDNSNNEEERGCDVVVPLCHLYEPQDRGFISRREFSSTRLIFPGFPRASSIFFDFHALVQHFPTFRGKSPAKD